ncbi:hypothetical protein ACN47E_010305 [Coniothyrium glycines]
MWLYGLPLAALFAAYAQGSPSDIGRPVDCRGGLDTPNDEACARPVHDIVAVAPGLSYSAKIECRHCSWAQRHVQEDHETHQVVRRDQIFYLNVTVSRNKRSILLNDRPLFPLPTIPTPPSFYVKQFPDDFSNTNLSHGLTCADPYCDATSRNPCSEWCFKIDQSMFKADYFYTVEPTSYDGEDNENNEEYWGVALDVIGGNDGYQDDLRWKFDDADQKMLWMLVAGQEAKSEAFTGERDSKAASDLFGPFGEKDKIYEYRIVDVRLTARTYTFPARKALSVWQSIGRFFGSDVWEAEDSRFVYISEEWGWYGKKGTLRNMFGEFIHWDFWWLFWVVISSTTAGLATVFGIYKLFFWIKQQRHLSNWDGMDDVWDRLRQEPTDEERDAFLDGGYRDDPDEGGSSRPPSYSDEPQTNKPLPDKPLPDKPLPAVPLIDA